MLLLILPECVLESSKHLYRPRLIRLRFSEIIFYFNFVAKTLLCKKIHTCFFLGGTPGGTKSFVSIDDSQTHVWPFLLIDIKSKLLLSKKQATIASVWLPNVYILKFAHLQKWKCNKFFKFVKDFEETENYDRKIALRNLW